MLEKRRAYGRKTKNTRVLHKIVVQALIKKGSVKKYKIIPNFEVEPELPKGVFQLVIEDNVRSPALQVNRP